ncbi:hypothetical protein HHK36_028554 [Tetracentron sinense]|uniref:DNA replication ATP-dependent helicase/nuclease n=1 Tax=Tetracentron sinense TaxID=13715 RepID=A0A834YHK2_TETSI|nr:hypothetical protein HHK36_028554 [Tetracentron sinense]
MTSSGSVDKLEKWLSSPTLRAPEISLVSSRRVPLTSVDPNQEVEYFESRGSAADLNNDAVNQQSPFRTPPSVSYCPDEVIMLLCPEHIAFMITDNLMINAKIEVQPANVVLCNGASDQLVSRQHRKALLELLDQVGDVIAVEEPMHNDLETNLSKVQDRNSDEMAVEAGPAVKTLTTVLPKRVNEASSDQNFLVLEVSEKRRTAHSSSAQCAFKVLRLLNEQSGEEWAVHLHDEWFYSVIGPGDTIHLIGEFDDQGKCDVNHDDNFLVIHPDILVSGTRVAASFSCPRRSVLDERLKCSEHSTAALSGTLLHQIFQAGLVREFPTKDFLEEYARIVIQKNIESLYACGVNENDIHKTMIEAIPRILNWLICFRDSQESKVPTVDFGSNDGEKKVKISEEDDPRAKGTKKEPKREEASMLTMCQFEAESKGQRVIHYTIKIAKHAPAPFAMLRPSVGLKLPNLPAYRINPTERAVLKRQSAMEHSAQVILYTLLMSERYMKHIDSGLLYYLHTDQTQGIAVRRSDLVGLIMRRNELANDILKASTIQQLPPMVQNLNMCKGCRHLNVCTVYHKAYGGNTESSGLGEAFDSHVEHLTSAQCAFLRQWDRLIDLEAKVAQAANKEIWRSRSLRSENSNCLYSIIIDTSNQLSPNKSLKDGRLIYRFVRQDLALHNADAHDGEHLSISSSLMNNLNCTLRIGDYVGLGWGFRVLFGEAVLLHRFELEQLILGTESGHLAVAKGVITDISRSHVSVSFSRRLRIPGSNPSSEMRDLLQEVWRIDKDEVTTSYAIMRFNLIQLFVQSLQGSHLRKMIVDLEAPRFDSGGIFSQDPAISFIWSEKNLNNDQRRAILKILTAKDYALILGMPGTGKTSTMVHAVKALLMRGASILLTSYTNSAVDNLLIKLKAQGIDFVRIGRYEAVHEEVRGHCFSAMDTYSVEDIKLRLDQVNIVAVTCLGITHPLLANKRFDVCIMDEAGQTTLPVSLGPLMFASTFVLVGDHYQLPPLVQSAEARENGMGISLFCRLSEAHPQAISALQCQYRMCAGIMELSNALIYDNRLRCGSCEIANAKLKFSDPKIITSWLKEMFLHCMQANVDLYFGMDLLLVLHHVLDPNRPVIFINTDMLPAFEAKDNKTLNNPTEAYIVAKITDELVNNGIIGEDIGIITPYNSQANLIRRVVCTTSVEIHTIDKYQGRDKDCILLSFVRSSEHPRACTSSLLGDWHRINVALTRAKKKLIMVGSCKTLSKVPLLKLLIEKVDEQSGILSPSKKDINYMGELKRCSQMRRV